MKRVRNVTFAIPGGLFVRADWSKLWRVICSNTARGKCTQIFAQKSIHSFRLETWSREGLDRQERLICWIRKETWYFLLILHRSVHFSIHLVNGKWKVRAVKLQWLFILWLQTICKLSSLAIDIDQNLRHSLRRPWATDLSMSWTVHAKKAVFPTIYGIITDLTLPLVLFPVTVQRKTFGIWA